MAPNRRTRLSPRHASETARSGPRDRVQQPRGPDHRPRRGPRSMAADTMADSPALVPARIAAPTTLALDPADIEAVLGYAEAAKAVNTRLAYASDWRHFSRWAATRGTAPLPCPPGLLCA